MMIAPRRKKQINELSQFIADNYRSKYQTDLLSIAASEDISYYFDDYEDAFDGMLVHDDNNYHIHINTARGNSIESKRGRFTFSHELGHYFLDEHRVGLKSGLLHPHGSIHNLNQKDKIEIEADYFAAALLMPEKLFRVVSGGRRTNFSLNTIMNLSESFQSSILSTVLRFSEIGTHEITAVISKKNFVQWYAQSHDFPHWPFKFRVGEQLPPATVAYEFFTKVNSKYTGIEDVDAEAWFHAKDGRANRTMHEQCYYSDSYDYVISLLWFD